MPAMTTSHSPNRNHLLAALPTEVGAAVVRRGELLLTASTGGQVPGLARALRTAWASRSCSTKCI